MLFPYRMCHFSQADFKILSLVFSSLTTMYLDMVLFVFILFGITVLLESVNLFLQRFFLFYSLNPFLLGFHLYIHLFNMIPKICKGCIKLFLVFFSFFRLNYFYCSVFKFIDSSFCHLSSLLSQFSKCFIRIFSFYSIFEISYLSINYNNYLTLHL